MSDTDDMYHVLPMQVLLIITTSQDDGTQTDEQVLRNKLPNTLRDFRNGEKRTACCASINENCFAFYMNSDQN